MLKFSPANAKTKRLKQVPQLKRYLAGGNKVYSFDLPAGWSCPFAKDCLAKVHSENGKLTLRDGVHTKYRCFSASQEVLYTNTYKLRQHNFNQLRGLHLNDMVQKIDKSLPDDCGILRLHVSGDFFSPDYMLAWIEIARTYKYMLIYAYTKSLLYWLRFRHMIPDNLILTASYGGTDDSLIRKYGLRYSKVVFSKYSARKLGLPIDHNDSHAATTGGHFALLLHGSQPAKSKASAALSRLRGIGSYSRQGG